jgi:hypothetical protein
MATDDQLTRRAQPGTGNAVQYPADDQDIAKGWRIYSGPGADEMPDESLVPWVTQIIEEVPF